MVTKFQFLLCLAGCGYCDDVNAKLEEMQECARKDADILTIFESDDAQFTVYYNPFTSRFHYTVREV